MAAQCSDQIPFLARALHSFDQRKISAGPGSAWSNAQYRSSGLVGLERRSSVSFHYDEQQCREGIGVAGVALRAQCGRRRVAGGARPAQFGRRRAAGHRPNQ
jgi:hypothetical protein